MHSTFSRLNPTCLPVFSVIAFVLAALSYLVKQDGASFFLEYLTATQTSSVLSFFLFHHLMVQNIS